MEPVPASNDLNFTTFTKLIDYLEELGYDKKIRFEMDYYNDLHESVDKVLEKVRKKHDHV